MISQILKKSCDWISFLLIQLTNNIKMEHKTDCMGMEVVQLYFYKGMTQQEIAEEIGIGRRSVGNCLEGALKKIRKNF